jgi:hypothetical protein
MVRRFYRANGAVIRGGGGLPRNYTIGIDLGKTVFHLVGLDPRGEVVVTITRAAGTSELGNSYESAAFGVLLAPPSRIVVVRPQY